MEEKCKKKKKINWKGIAVTSIAATILTTWWGMNKAEEAATERGRRQATEAANMDLLDIIHNKK